MSYSDVFCELAPTLMSYGCVAGIFCTVIMAKDSAVEAYELIKEVEDELGSELHWHERLFVTLPCYTKVVLAAASTMACVLMAKSMYCKQIQALNVTYQAAMAEAQGYSEQVPKDSNYIQRL